MDNGAHTSNHIKISHSIAMFYYLYLTAVKLIENIKVKIIKNHKKIIENVYYVT